MRAILCFAASLIACGGEMPMTNPDAAVVLPPTLTRVEAEVFAISCNFAACHSSTRPEKGLDLTGKTHAKLVGVAAVEKPTAKLVVAGDPDASFMMDKILGRNLPMAPAGENPWTPMPYPLGGLDADRTELFRAWIAAGAKDD